MTQPRFAAKRFVDPRRHVTVERHLVRKPTPAHLHEYYELELILEGEGEHFINGKRFTLSPGTVYLLTPVDVHAVIPAAPIELVNLSFEADRFPGIPAPWETDGERIYNAGDRAAAIAFYLEELRRELEESEADLSRAAVDLMELVLLTVLRLNRAARASLPRSEKSVSLPGAIRYLQEHFRERVTLGDAAAACGYSETYFSRLFRETTGVGFHVFLTRLRIHHAKLLLAQTKKSVTEIAADSGFDSPSNFFRAFRLEEGVSPHRFRALFSVDK